MALTKLGRTWYDTKQITNIIEPNEEVVQTRYSNKTQMRLENGDIIIRNTRLSDIEVPESDSDTVHKIEASERYRPDLVAFRVYNNANLAWVLLSANNMKSFFEFETDVIIRIPEITSLYSSGGVLNK